MPDRLSATLVGGTIHRTRGDAVVGDLHLVDGRVAVEPAAGVDTLDISGLALLPLRREFADGSDDLLAPGTRASLAVVRLRPPERAPRGTVIVRPDDVRLLVLDGRVLTVDARPATTAAPDPEWVGDWRDERTGMIQHLRADGRYSETRGGRPDAWTGRYWTGGDLIVYLDDTGFWAFGLREGETVRHADFVLRRTPSVS